MSGNDDGSFSYTGPELIAIKDEFHTLSQQIQAVGDDMVSKVHKLTDSPEGWLNTEAGAGLAAAIDQWKNNFDPQAQSLAKRGDAIETAFEHMSHLDKGIGVSFGGN